MKGFILVIDDNPLDVKIASGSVERMGFSAQGFTKSSEAQEWLKTNKPAVVLLDLQMPEITGFELLPKLKEIMGQAAAPIIIISGKNQTDDILKAIKLGASDYIVKPIDPLVLQEKVEKLTSQNKQEYFSADLIDEKVNKALLATEITILSVSEFGVKLKFNEEVPKGDVLHLVGLKVDVFGTDTAFVRALNCVKNENSYFVETTFIGLLEAQRQVIRKYCRQIWVDKKRGQM